MNKKKCMTLALVAIMVIGNAPEALAASASDGDYLGGTVGTDPLKIIYSEEMQSVDVQRYKNGYSSQYYGQDCAGISFRFNYDGNTYTYNTPYHHYANSSAVSLGTGSNYSVDITDNFLTQKWDDVAVTDGVTFDIELKYEYISGDDFLNRYYTITPSGGTFTDVKLSYGGDTYFSGSDSGYSYAIWNDAVKMVYLKGSSSTSSNDTMTLSSNTATRYYAGYYYEGLEWAANFTDTNYTYNPTYTGTTDNGYYLQWDIGTIEDSVSATRSALEAFCGDSNTVRVLKSQNEQLEVSNEEQRATLSYVILSIGSSPVEVTDFVPHCDNDNVTTSYTGTASYTIPAMGSITTTAELVIPANTPPSNIIVNLSYNAGGNDGTGSSVINLYGENNLDLDLSETYYTGDAYEPEVIANAANASITYYYKLHSADESTYTTTAPSEVGDYDIKASTPAHNNYYADEFVGEFSISYLTPPSSSSPFYEIEGTSDKQGWYSTDVAIKPISTLTGYKIATALDGEYGTQLSYTEEGTGVGPSVIYLMDSEGHKTAGIPVTEIISIDKTAPQTNIAGMAATENEKVFSGEGDKQVIIADDNLQKVIVASASTKEGLESATGTEQTITDGSCNVVLKENSTDTWYKVTTIDKSGNKNIKIVKIIAPKENTFRVSGTIVDKDDKALGNATVSLIEGNKVIATTITNADGSYIFSGIPKGNYTVQAATASKKIVEECNVSNANVGVDKMVMPNGIQNTDIKIKTQDTPNITVSGLNKLFIETTTNTEDSKEFTVADKAIIDAGGSVTIRLEVEKKDSTIKNAEEINKKATTLSKKVGAFLELDVIKSVLENNGGTEKETKLVELPELIKVSIPFDEAIKGKDNYNLLRYHGEAVDVLTLTANAYGEKIELKADGSGMIAYLKKFSTYAIAYDDVPAINTTTTAAKTADDMPIVPFTIMLILSVSAMVPCTMIYFKKKRRA